MLVHVRTLKELGRSYLIITKDVNRLMNRIKAVPKLSHGVGLATASIGAVDNGHNTADRLFKTMYEMNALELPMKHLQQISGTNQRRVSLR
jgi:hypothetical protein